ncbi:MAG TPA: DUF1428 domain-containing protein [Sphingomicrobium sp.]|nr:DUF1428 domain-containing protein [Sphingomicrobium sp.]
MTYFEGFIVPVPEGNKDAFAKHANSLSALLKEVGVERQAEAWASDVPEGKLTDFNKAVNAAPGEKTVFAWFEYADRAARDAANQRMMTDPRMEAMGVDVPFDGKRMVLGGFEAIVEEGAPGGNYVDGFVVPVPTQKREAYRALAAKMATVFREHGASRVVEAFGDDVQHGEVTDFYRAVQAVEGEGIVFSFIEWPDKATRDQAWGKIMSDDSMKPDGGMPFDGKRMFWGGFEKVIDTAKSRAAADA